MNFPLRVGLRTVGSAPELGALARADAQRGGGVVPGQRVWQWVSSLVAEGSVDRGSAAALAAGLVRLPEAATIAEGARLAAVVGDAALGELLLAALRDHDTGLLLGPDPADPRSSVEDAVLRAVVAVAPLGDAALRADLLERLRNAALRSEELAVLCRWGTDEELATWLPAILTEGVPDALRPAVLERSDRSQSSSGRVRSLLASALGVAPAT